MSVGHGALGLLDRLRDFAGLMDSLVVQSEGQSRPYLELQLGLEATGLLWVVHSGSIYRYRRRPATGDDPAIYGAMTNYGGRYRGVVGVETMVSPRGLMRVESLADVVAGTFYVDETLLVSDPDFVGGYDVYVQLPDSSDPGSTTVVLMLLFTFGVAGEVHPWLGPNKLTDGGLEIWSSSSVLTNWTAGLDSGWSLAQVADTYNGGAYAAKLALAAAGTGTRASIRQDKAVIGGKAYRLAGRYKTKATGMATATQAAVRISKSDDTADILVDGRSTAASSTANSYPLRETFGAWRRFLFDCQIPAAWTTVRIRALGWNSSGGAVGDGAEVYFDALRFQRVYRWNFYEPRIGESSIPALEVASQSNTFGGKTISIGSVSLINADGMLEVLFDQLLAINRPAQIWMGGAFADGQEIYRDDWRGAFPALTRKAEVEDEQVTLELEDPRTLAKMEFPPNRYSVDEYADIDPTAEGRPKPLHFGDSRDHNIRAIRTGLTGDGFGQYEIIDPEVPVADSVAVDVSAGALRVYPNEEMADKDVQGYDIGDSTLDFSFTAPYTVWYVLRDIRNYRYDRGGDDVGTNSAFDFDVGGATLTAYVDVVGPGYKVASDLQVAMRAAIGGGDTTTTVVLNETTHKVTVARSGGATLRLRPQTGPNSHRQSWALSGYDTSSDKTGASTYTGERATFTDPAADHIIRFKGGGFKDNAVGAICGAANAALDTAPAVASWILQKVCKIPAAKIDVPSFSATRVALQAEDCRVRAYYDQERNVSDVLAELERSALMDLVVDGEGVWRCARNPTTIARTFTDADYLTWKMWRDPAQVYRLVRVLYGYHPALARFLKTVEVTSDAGVAVKHGSDQVLEVPSWLDDDGGAIAAAAGVLATRLSKFSGTSSLKLPRVVEFDAAGKLVDLLIGNKISITRSRGLSSTGALSAVTFRVLGLRHNYLTGVSTCTAIEAITYT